MSAVDEHTTRRDLAVLTGATVLLNGPLLLAGRFLDGHDASMYLLFGAQYAANLREGLVLPAWAADLNNGFGAAGLLFNTPLVHFLHGLLLVVGIALPIGMTLVAAGAHALSGLTCLWAVRALGATRTALPAAIVYMAAPYRLVDLYPRTALAEHFAFIWPPLLIMAALAPALSPNRRALLVTGATFALLVAHAPTSILVSLLMAAALFLMRNVRRNAVPLVGGATLGAGLAAFLLVPQMLADRYLLTEAFFSGLAPKLRPSANTLFNDVADVPSFNREVSYCLIVMVGLVLAAAAVVLRERRDSVVRLWTLSGVLAFVVTLQPFGPLWDLAPVLSRTQFPWRTGTIIVASLAFLVGAMRSPATAWVTVAIASAASVPWLGTSTIAAVASTDLGNRSELYPDARLAAEVLAFRQPPDGRLKLVDGVMPMRILTTAALAELSGFPRPEFDGIRDRPAFVTSSVGVTIESLKPNGQARRVRVTSPAAADVVLHTFDFPDMQVDVNGQSAPSFRESSTALLGVSVPAGEHVISWRWEPPAAFSLGRMVSSLALVVLLTVVGRSRRGRQQRT